MSKLITVFGATGNQGGSVINHLLDDPALSKEYKIRGITRDESKPAAKALADKGIELRKANMDDEQSVMKAIAGSHTIFLVTNYWETANSAIEVSQGKNVANAAKQEGVSHLIFSSLLDVTKASNGKLTHVPHFDGKADIEEHIKSTGVPCTFVLPGYFMSNLTQMIQKSADGSLNLALPINPHAKFPLFDASADMGLFVKAAMKMQDKPSGNRIFAATDYYTPKQILSEIEQVTGRKTNFLQVSDEQYKSYFPKFMAQEMLENHKFIEEPGYYGGSSLKESLALLDGKPTTWQAFLKNSGAFK